MIHGPTNDRAVSFNDDAMRVAEIYNGFLLTEHMDLR